MWWVAILALQVATPVAVNEVVNTQPSKTINKPHKMGICTSQYTDNPGFTIISPDGGAEMYISEYLNKSFSFTYQADYKTLRNDSTLSIIQPPKFGKLVQDDFAHNKFQYQYINNDGFSGIDHFAFELKAEGMTVQVFYTMHVLEEGEPTYAIGDNGERVTLVCDLEHWKIS